ncbi:hypothetical protein [Streptomyces halobius]|uniref:Uncharacterized protein n=1 Tax=Streptomyces halobius TaxID=2879846 RepID=A0ABY4M458_9ACTN|nr:hypothetical protein [Streptomyces halobius]UQA92539.1 hypothetical protein K9S39_12535 [Streptomyces halobius]
MRLGVTETVELSACAAKAIYALGLQLPQQDIQEGTVRAAQWARSNR